MRNFTKTMQSAMTSAMPVLISASAVLSFQPQALATSQQEVPAILLQDARPTIAQINKEFPVQPVDFEAPTRVTDDMMEQIPRLIAAFEYAFPGATYYELGRDAVYLGDIVDAFYTSIGQPDRVRRLDASNTSFSSDDVVTNEFLKGAGIDVLKLDKGYPAVVFDVTSFNHVRGVGSGASQSVQVIRSGYAAYVQAGGDPKDLIHRYNFISVGGMFGSPEINVHAHDFNLEKFFAAQKATASDKGFAKPLFVDGGHFTYRYEGWHRMFGPFYKGADGVTRGELPTEAPDKHDLSDRASILRAMIEARDIASSPEFLKAVERESLALGFKFSVKRTMNPERIPAEEMARLRKIAEEERRAAALKKSKGELARMKASRNKANKLSPLADEYFDQVAAKILLDNQHPLDAVKFIVEDLQQSSNLDRWTDGDLLAFLKLFYSATYAMDSEDLMKSLAKVAQRHARFAKLVMETGVKSDLYGTDENKYRIERNQEFLQKQIENASIEKPGKSCSGLLRSRRG